MVTPVLATILAACHSSSDGTRLVGPCIHLFEDEVLHIDAAEGTMTGAVIGQIDLLGFRVDGVERRAEDIMGQRTFNVVRLGATLRCTVPCAFGTEAGQWEFTAVAVGYRQTLQSVEAQYATFSSGCPSYETDGTHVAIELDE